MKKTLASAVILAAAFGASAAYADNLEPDNASYQAAYGQVAPNSESRAQVVRELEAAGINNREPDNASYQAPYGRIKPGTESRAQVEQQLDSPKWQASRLQNNSNA